ncbi:hypothetical protein RAN53_10870 [Halomonas sp. SSL-5]|uniref:hypothetical protein n=1 Tax=Halomonas sp. SSL-5 TaxID=3065855 RepID=UPI002738825F|nr:hypothetical protein [Halomonas sp. SSL-5]MDY7116852.1 hypothetical protein [Halomonas sp. SSL-5]
MAHQHPHDLPGSDTHPEASSGAHEASYSLQPIQPIPREPIQPIPTDWWRCQRRGPVSGRYEGPSTSPTPDSHELVLRVDIDPVQANAPVMDRISADLYRVFSFTWNGRTLRWRRYVESWIVENPSVSWQRCYVDVKGEVTYWEGSHPATRFGMRIPWGTFQPAGPAELFLTPSGGTTTRYTCKRVSSYFRDLMLEVDVCTSVNADPILPVHDTHSHSTRPADLPERDLDLVEAYREAGIDVTLASDRTIIDDSAASFNQWSPSELHDAMETHFSQMNSGWPKWHMWGLLCGQYDRSTVAGVMFDALATYGGAGEAPDRQGFAVFREHSWFNSLVENPSTQAEASAMRQFLYTWVHEAGHAFNMLHSWDKSRPGSLSWMNYPQRVSNFWGQFEFRFDDEELIHIRHGNRAAVIMGGDEWASGGHLKGGAHGDFQGSDTELAAPLELVVRSNGYFEFMEPVFVEVRLRNLMPDMPFDINAQFAPDFAQVSYQIRKPDGSIVEYHPLLAYIAQPEMLRLEPANDSGSDRLSQRVFLHYGREGFLFDQPGMYSVRAAYHGIDGISFQSATHHLRVGAPHTPEADRLAQDYFCRDVGTCLYLHGSQSPHLRRGMEVIHDVADRFKGSTLGAGISAIAAECEARPHFRIEGDKLKQAHKPDPEAALTWLEPAMKLFRKTEDRALNLPYHEMSGRRVDWLQQLGKKDEAKKEITTLVKDLKKRGVRASVIERITAAK